MGEVTSEMAGVGHTPARKHGNRDVRLIHDRMDLACMEPADAEFYRNNRQLSEHYISLEGERQGYIRQNPCMPLLFFCMDEKEQDTEESLGLPPGAANVYPTAGNRIGEINLVLCKEMQTRIDRAYEAGKRVLVLFITHESYRDATHDSCAAWSHRCFAADGHADFQVQRFNEDYVDRDKEGRVARRHVIAVRLKSYTDLESRVWYGANDKCVDPLEFVRRSVPPNTAEYEPDGLELEASVLRRFVEAFPFKDPRFSGLERHEWNEVLMQMVRMFLANVRYMRGQVRANTDGNKLGHQGTRVLVGRGWEMYQEVNKYFKVSDFSPDLLRECCIAGKYVIKNGIVARLNGASELRIPFHINVPYDMMRPGDRSGSIRHAMSLARAIKCDWQDRLRNPASEKRFHDDLCECLMHEDLDLDEIGLRNAICEFGSTLLDQFRFIVSVSPRETRKLEVVATGGDL